MTLIRLPQSASYFKRFELTGTRIGRGVAVAAPLSSATGGAKGLSNMRESLTETLRSTLAEAQKSARELNQDFVGTEHLMLGILAVDGEAGRSLRSAHGVAAEIKSGLMQSLPKGKQDPVVTGDLPMSPKAQRVFNGAIVKAQSMRASAVSTRFLLLSLMDEMPPAARAAMVDSGVDCDALAVQLAAKPERVES